MFALSFDPQRGLVEIKLSGLMSLDEVRDLHLELVAELDHLGLEPGAYDLLLDTSEFAIQPQEVHKALEAFSHDRRTRPARAAFVTGASAQRMQARRVRVSYPREFFYERRAALEWLRTLSQCLVPGHFAQGVVGGSSAAMQANRPGWSY